MKQGNSPETATASGFRAELRQEENAGWDTWERKAETATEHSRNTTGIAWQRPPSLKWWQQLKRPKESNKPWKQVRGGSQFLPSLSIQGKTPKGGKKKRKKNTGKHQSQNLNQHFYYSGLIFQWLVQMFHPPLFIPTLHSGNFIFLIRLRKRLKVKTK